MRDEILHDLVKKHFPKAEDPEGLLASLREDFLIYRRDRYQGRKPSEISRNTVDHNQAREDITKLHGAAARGDVAKTKKLLDDLLSRPDPPSPAASPDASSALTAWWHLEARAKQRGISFPPDPASSDFCEMIAAMCRVGGKFCPGKKRKSGKRSKTWKTELYAPAATTVFQKLEAERYFIIHLQLTWLRATGKMPAATAKRAPTLGPFARFAQECFELADAKHVDIANIINSVAKDGRKKADEDQAKKAPGCHPDREQMGKDPL
jgi:hypothetical protein